jgi:lysophospholipase L1-like esterase
MKRFVVFLLLALPLAAQAATNLATIPIDRLTIPWWKMRWEQTLASRDADPGAKLVWLGDSITQFWQRQGTRGFDNILPVWNRYYAPYQALDFGFVGDATSSLIWRLDHGQVAGLHPKLAIILIGANNFGRLHWDAAMTIPGIETVVAVTHAKLPGAHILLLGVLPSIRSPWVDAQTAATNAALARFYAGNPVVSFIDLAPVLTKDGKCDPSLYIDPKDVPPKPALHPDATGMARIAAFIQPEVERYAR